MGDFVINVPIKCSTAKTLRQIKDRICNTFADVFVLFLLWVIAVLLEVFIGFGLGLLTELLWANYLSGVVLGIVITSISLFWAGLAVFEFKLKCVPDETTGGAS